MLKFTEHWSSRQGEWTPRLSCHGPHESNRFLRIKLLQTEPFFTGICTAQIALQF